MGTTTFSFRTHFQCPFKCHAFCGIPERLRTLSPIDSKTGLRKKPQEEELRTQFNTFLNEQSSKSGKKENLEAIQKQRRIVLAPNGSVVPEVPKVGREIVHGYCMTHGYRFESPFAAPLVDLEYAEQLYEAEYGRKGRYGSLSDIERKRIAREVVDEIETALNDEFPNKNVLLNLGLENSNEDDLKILGKYHAISPVNRPVEIEIFVRAAHELKNKGISVGANILLGGPGIGDPIHKALETAKFAFEIMKVDKVYLSVWIPHSKTSGIKEYKDGVVDVMSATEAFEIKRIIAERYPDKEVELSTNRAQFWHGMHNNFKGLKIKGDGKKEIARANVRKIAETVFGYPSMTGFEPRAVALGVPRSIP